MRLMESCRPSSPQLGELWRFGCRSSLLNATLGPVPIGDLTPSMGVLMLQSETMTCRRIENGHALLTRVKKQSSQDLL